LHGLAGSTPTPCQLVRSLQATVCAANLGEALMVVQDRRVGKLLLDVRKGPFDLRDEAFHSCRVRG
jgi:hypothetical protein